MLDPAVSIMPIAVTERVNLEVMTLNPLLPCGD